MEGGNYPPTPLKGYLAWILGYLKYGAFAFVMFGETIFGWIGMAVPNWYVNVKEKSWMFTMGLFFLFNMVETSLNSTGAFEIYVDDKEVFSKLKAGRMITETDLVEVLRECGIENRY